MEGNGDERGERGKIAKEEGGQSFHPQSAEPSTSLPSVPASTQTLAPFPEMPNSSHLITS